MGTDPATSAAAAAVAFYSPFPPPPSACDFNVRSTIVSPSFAIEYNHFSRCLAGQFNVISFSISSTASTER